MPGITVGLIKCDQPAVPTANTTDLPILPVNGQQAPNQPGSARLRERPHRKQIREPRRNLRCRIQPRSTLVSRFAIAAGSEHATDRHVTMLRAAITEQEDVPARAVAESALEELTELQKTIASSHDTEYPTPTVPSNS